MRRESLGCRNELKEAAQIWKQRNMTNIYQVLGKRDDKETLGGIIMKQ